MSRLHAHASSSLRGTAWHGSFVRVVAALFLCGHLAGLPGHLEDIDSLNFALGVESYDIAAHQPHPPGYPVFIVLARATTAVVRPFTPADAAPVAVGMALLAACAGALALLLLHAILRIVSRRDDVSPANAAAVVALTAAAPLFWLTAARPLSDMPGLAGALLAHWLILRARHHGTRLGPALVAGLACGIVSGLRSQVSWLVVPMLVWLLWHLWRVLGVRGALATAAAAVGGVLTWAVPMVVLSGGLEAYRTALASQAGEDFDGVAMLLMQPGPARLVLNLIDTWVWPWGFWPIAVVVLGLMLAGVAGVARRPGLRTWLLLGFGPYVVGHLLVQETETTRYALPVIPLCATLVVAGSRLLASRHAMRVLSVVVVACMFVSVKAHWQYLSSGSSITEVLSDWDEVAGLAPSRPQVLMHRRVWAETRRARTMRGATSYDVLPAERAREWREVARSWQEGGDPVVWWMADPVRGDRVAIDPRSQRLQRRVAWPMPLDALLGGMRPHAFDWYDVTRPQWVLLDGWALTPELAGLAAAATEGPSTSGAHALVRRMTTAATLVIGGRHIAPTGAGPVDIEVRIGESWLQVLRVPPGGFASTWTIPPGALDGRSLYIPLEVRVIGAPAGPERISLEQFDIQPDGVPVVALLEGWYEPERSPATGRQWRWMADRSLIRVSGTSRDVTIRLAGTWPRHYDETPELETLMNDRLVSSQILPRSFTTTLAFTAASLRASGGRVEWRVSPSFVAGERTGTADARRLALEIASVTADVVH